MNYLKEILAFHNCLEINQLDATDQALWYHLMHINNKCGWTEWFTVANMSLQARLGGIDKKTLERHRLNLINAKLIEYKNQGKKQAGKYRIARLSENIGGDIGGNIPLEPSLSVPYLSPETPPLTKGKQNKTKQKDNPLTPLKQKYADFVTMTEIEYQKLVEKFGEQGALDRIENLNLYKGSKGVKYESDYLTILSWDRKSEKEKPKDKYPANF